MDLTYNSKPNLDCHWSEWVRQANIFFISSLFIILHLIIFILHFQRFQRGMDNLLLGSICG